MEHWCAGSDRRHASWDDDGFSVDPAANGSSVVNEWKLSMAAVLDRLQARCDENWERHFAAREAHEAAAEVAQEMDEDEAAIWARVDAERREWEEDDDVRDLYGLRDEL